MKTKRKRKVKTVSISEAYLFNLLKTIDVLTEAAFPQKTIIKRLQRINQGSK